MTVRLTVPLKLCDRSTKTNTHCAECTFTNFLDTHLIVLDFSQGGKKLDGCDLKISDQCQLSVCEKPAKAYSAKGTKQTLHSTSLQQARRFLSTGWAITRA